MKADDFCEKTDAGGYQLFLYNEKLYQLSVIQKHWYAALLRCVKKEELCY